MEALRIENLYKSYGNVQVLKGINLKVEQGEFLSLLGPSGCGKTTLLRIISGLTNLTSGNMYVEGKEISNLPTYKRNNGMVFQNYALFPHMTVWQNIAFGLKMHHVPKEEIKSRTQKALEMIHLENLGSRYPKELSGGQQQRVALVRALVLNPTLLLLDEPLCNLDAKLRKEMRIEIRRIQKELKITTIFVTHDQEEALSMSDQIAVINEGCIEQIGTPEDLYNHPCSRFVANFIGNTNLFTCTLKSQEESEITGLYGVVKVKAFNTEQKKISGEFSLSVRPDRVTIGRNVIEGKNNLKGTIRTKVYLGSLVRFIIKDCNDNEISAEVPSLESKQFNEGDTVNASWDISDGLIIV